MSDKEKHNIKNLFRNIDLDTPPINFTDKVMKKVDIISDDMIHRDEALSSLLKKNSLEVTSFDFSTKIMAKINTNTVADYKPIISKKGWNVIYLLFTSFVIYALLFNPKTTQNNSYISKFSTFFNDLIADFGNSLSQNIQIPSILTVSILCLSVLLLLDALLRTKKIF